MTVSLARRAHRFTAAAASVLVLPAIVLAAVTESAEAATNDQTVSGVASPIWQPNAPVDALATANGVIYAGGNFTSVKPGAGQSGTATSRTYLAAFNGSTGALVTTFNVTLNGRIYALDVSPDRNTLYIGGSFSTVNGTARNKIAAINIPSGTLNTTFNPNANRPVRSIESTSSTVYFGGDFTTVKNTARANLASVTASTGALNTAFAPTFIQRPDSVNPFDGTVTTYTPNVLALAHGTRREQAARRWELPGHQRGHQWRHGLGGPDHRRHPAVGRQQPRPRRPADQHQLRRPGQRHRGPGHPRLRDRDR